MKDGLRPYPIICVAAYRMAFLKERAQFFAAG